MRKNSLYDSVNLLSSIAVSGSVCIRFRLNILSSSTKQIIKINLKCMTRAPDLRNNMNNKFISFSRKMEKQTMAPKRNRTKRSNRLRCQPNHKIDLNRIEHQPNAMTIVQKSDNDHFCFYANNTIKHLPPTSDTFQSLNSFLNIKKK